jgi:phage terminase large subunit
MVSKLLKEIRATAKELAENFAVISASCYETWRDDDANLYIRYDDGSESVLPYIPFRPYQIEAAQKLFLEGINRILLERPRRSGKEVESWNCIIEAAIESPGLYMMVYPTNVRARAVLWDGAILMPDGESVKFLNMIPKKVLTVINNQEMKIKLVNDSVIWIVGSDIDPDKLRGTNPRGIVFSEFAYQDPRVFYIMLPALRQNGGWLIGQSTFDGMNHFYQLIENNKDDPLWYCRVDSITNLVDEYGNRYITDEMIEEDRRSGMPEYLIQQEYYGVVEINQETKYFAHAINFMLKNERFGFNLSQPNGNLYTFWDLGVNDKTAIVLVQFFRKFETVQPYVVGYIEDNNREFKYYIDAIRQFASRKGLIVHSHFAPHDGAERDYYNGLKDIRAHGQALGETFQVVRRPPTLQYGIEVIRQTLHNTYIDKGECQRLIDCLSNYSKEYNDRMGVYKNSPVHDWSSHGVKAFQTLALALTDKMISDRTYETVYYNR